VFLVTVDGRQLAGTGMSQDEFAKLLIELGCYNGLNFDGGMSTTMVGRIPGKTSLATLNKPSQGSERKVSSGIGVTTTAPSGELKQLIITCDDENVFVNTARTFSISGVDEYSNPVVIDPSKVKWSVSGVEGYFEGSTLKPASIGEGIVKASYSGVSTVYNISVLSEPSELIISPKKSSLAIGKQLNFSVKARNKNGYYALIDPSFVKWSCTGSAGTIENGIFTASGSGLSVVSASCGSAVSYAGVSISQTPNFP
jgi:hypothetical protein